jgi:uncharacterized membrane protein
MQKEAAHEAQQISVVLARALWQRRRRTIALLAVVGALLVMGFYTVTDAQRLATSLPLNGADWAGYALCHRLPGHSLTINGRQLPLCARCTGMYLGAAVALGVLGLSGRLRRADLPPWPVLLLLVGLIGMMGIDGLNSFSHFLPNGPRLYEPRNWLRLVTGMGTGLAMGLILAPAVAQTLWRAPEFTPVLGGLRELADLLVLALVVILLALSNQPAILYVLSLVSTAGLLAIVAALNMVVLLIGARRDGRATRWRETAVPLALGLLLAILELGAISYARFSLTGTMTGFPGL